MMMVYDVTLDGMKLNSVKKKIIGRIRKILFKFISEWK